MRKNFFRYIRSCSAILIVMVIVIFSGKYNIHASNIGSDSPAIMVEHYTVTDEKIVPGQNFTLTMELKNYSRSKAANNVVISVVNPNGVAPVYGTTSQIYVGSIAAGEKKAVSIDYCSWTSIEGESLDFTLYITSAQANNNVILRIPVGADSPFNIIAKNVSSEIEQFGSGNATVSFNILADSNVSNISMLLKEGEDVIATSVIGSVTAGTSKSQTVSFSLDTVGEHAVEMLLQYTDESGLLDEVSVGSWNVKVNQNDTQTSENFDDISDEDTVEAQNNNIVIMGVVGTLILIICLVVVILLRRRR